MTSVERERAQRAGDDMDCPGGCRTPDGHRLRGLALVSYGDGKPYWRCPVGHVTPKPPPPDIRALDDWSDEDD